MHPVVGQDIGPLIAGPIPVLGHEAVSEPDGPAGRGVDLGIALGRASAVGDRDPEGVADSILAEHPVLPIVDVHPWSPDMPLKLALLLPGLALVVGIVGGDLGAVDDGAGGRGGDLDVDLELGAGEGVQRAQVPDDGTAATPSVGEAGCVADVGHAAQHGVGDDTVGGRSTTVVAVLNAEDMGAARDGVAVGPLADAQIGRLVPVGQHVGPVGDDAGRLGPGAAVGFNGPLGLGPRGRQASDDGKVGGRPFQGEADVGVVQGLHAHQVWVGDGPLVVLLGVFDVPKHPGGAAAGGRIQGAQHAILDIVGRHRVGVGPGCVAAQGEGIDRRVGGYLPRCGQLGQYRARVGVKVGQAQEELVQVVVVGGQGGVEGGWRAPGDLYGSRVVAERPLVEVLAAKGAVGTQQLGPGQAVLHRCEHGHESRVGLDQGGLDLLVEGEPRGGIGLAGGRLHQRIVGRVVVASDRADKAHGSAVPAVGVGIVGAPAHPPDARPLGRRAISQQIQIVAPGHVLQGGADAQRVVPHVADGFGDGLVIVGGVDHEGDGRIAGVAGLCQQVQGHGRRVGAADAGGVAVDVAHVPRRGVGQRWRLVAAEHVADEKGPVDGRGQGPPHERVVQGGHVVGEAIDVGVGSWKDVQLQAVGGAGLDRIQGGFGRVDGVQLVSLVAGPSLVLVDEQAGGPGDYDASGVVIVIVLFQNDVGVGQGLGRRGFRTVDGVSWAGERPQPIGGCLASQ